MVYTVQEENRIAPVSQLIPTVEGRESAPRAHAVLHAWQPVDAIPMARMTALNSGP